MTLLRQIQKRSSRDSICDAMTLTSDEYETLYAEVKREIRERAILYQSLRTTTAKEHIRQIARVVARLRTITHLAVRCNYNATRRMRSKRRKMRCNYNPETRLRNNDEYAEAIVYSAGQSNTVNNAPQLSTILVAKYKDISSLNYTQFIRTLKREVRFEDKRSSIYYYTKIADSWTRIRISTEARWHSALQDTVATKLYRATFVIELLI
ncbi:hypothetical protein HBI88_150440 [Parastagonospora nodorum]|nr:hypothetical protein HBI97_011410 [Parastagonospora nodorum]KAH5810649.1 hypothetical protein HBI94_153080 [Parastagonospora nodorum]KAH5841749.1 hypothetical protein HBI93_011910 [Parastagonospora nodorum]KAH5843945.1 hypothetical protein HBI96_009350 [Parastagonospora nodorum]KAH5855585.1 hypothetical protein HBI91_161890 [Parastagonospora nodorum]